MQGWQKIFRGRSTSTGVLRSVRKTVERLLSRALRTLPYSTMAPRKMEEADLAGVIAQFMAIKYAAVEIRRPENPWITKQDEASALIISFNDASRNFIKVKGDSKIFLEYIDPISAHPASRPEPILLRVIIECEKALGTLNKMASPALTPDEIDRLGSLRQELEKISDITYVRALEEAIGEYEKCHHLASALISSRMIVFSLDKILPGKSDEERVQHLVQVGKIEKSREDVQRQIIKAGRKARNFLSHDIGIFPKPEEALSLLGDCVTIVKLVH